MTAAKVRLIELLTSPKYSGSKKDYLILALLCNNPSEASTKIVSRKDGGTQLPLHLALRTPPSSVDLIKALIKANPVAVMTKETSSGMLPIHLATRYGAHPDVVNILLMHYPQGHSVKDKQGRTPLDYATKYKDYPNDENRVVMVLRRSLQYEEVCNAYSQRTYFQTDYKVTEAKKKSDKVLSNLKKECAQDRDKLNKENAMLKTKLKEREKDIGDLETMNKLLQQTTKEARSLAMAPHSEIVKRLETKSLENEKLKREVYRLKHDVARERTEKIRTQEDLSTTLSKTTMKLTKDKTNLQTKLYESQRTAVIQELEAHAAMSTADNLSCQIVELHRASGEAFAKLGDILEKEKWMVKQNQALNRIVVSLKSDLKTSRDNEMKLARRVAKMEGLVKTTKSTIGMIEKRNSSFFDQMKLSIEQAATSSKKSSSPPPQSPEKRKQGPITFPVIDSFDDISLSKDFKRSDEKFVRSNLQDDRSEHDESEEHAEESRDNSEGKRILLEAKKKLERQKQRNMRPSVIKNRKAAGVTSTADMSVDEAAFFDNICCA